MRRNQPLRDCFDDLLVHFIDGEVPLDEHDAICVARGDLAVFFPDAFEEFALLQLEAVFVFTGLSSRALVAIACAGEA